MAVFVRGFRPLEMKNFDLVHAHDWMTFPAVISKQPGVAEVLGGALSADCRDIDGMARRICRLLDDEKFRARVVRRMSRDIESAT